MAQRTHGATLLRQAYKELDLSAGKLLEATSRPGPDLADNWRDDGEWLMLAERMGAERVFFVGSDPVVVFASLSPDAGETEIVRAYRRAWSLARPRCLFLATPDELRVYALSAPPVGSPDEEGQLRPVEIITRAAEVSERLALFRRESLEAGALFDHEAFRDRAGRADAQLLSDLRTAVSALVADGLDRSVAHALIERIILVRYLEDREIIGRGYFESVAGDNEHWRGLLDAHDGAPQLGAVSSFLNCLRSRPFTYAVFTKLQGDFNGDLFLVSEDEMAAITPRHLTLVRGLFTGAGSGDQYRLFLWAYDFGIVPTSLISSMYEEFYRAGTDDDSGTHYTPPELVEFVLGETLTADVLDRAPVVCDPACGSGIFLVEAFRRIVRHEVVRRGRRLSPPQLRTLLLRRLVGIDLNPEAIRLAAFSLYLAFLNYQTPRDIRDAGPLPKVIIGNATADVGILVVADAFTPTASELSTSQSVRSLPWPSSAFDVVVGNPPWDEPDDSADRLPDSWASELELPVGDRNRSQLFLWRAMSLLKPGGVGSMLVGATAFHNSRSKAFRSRWLESVSLEGVVNFTSARHLFFDGGVAPFIWVKFRHDDGVPGLPKTDFLYQVVRPSAALSATRSVDQARLERRWVSQSAIRMRDYLWKTYAWGTHHDDAFMARLDIERRVRDFLTGEIEPGYGYQRGKENRRDSTRPSERLASLRSLKRFESWGPLRTEWFESPPDWVKRQPDERIYEGQRLLVARGVKSGFGPRARLESEEFSFRHTIYALPVPSMSEWQARTILGVLLSSLGRYRLFMTSGSWGVWHDSFVPDDILDLPMRMPGRNHPLIKRIGRLTRRLQGDAGGLAAGVLFPAAEPNAPNTETLRELDEAVFELFDLTPAERDLVNDFCRETLPLVGRKLAWTRLRTTGFRGEAHGLERDLDAGAENLPLRRYLATLVERWNRELAPGGEFAWSVVAPSNVGLIAVTLETRAVGAPMLELPLNEALWVEALGRLERSLGDVLPGAIRRGSAVRAVSSTTVTIVKRDESRLWTASSAREDAEATLLQAMALQSG